MYRYLGFKCFSVLSSLIILLLSSSIMNDATHTYFCGHPLKDNRIFAITNQNSSWRQTLKCQTHGNINIFIRRRLFSICIVYTTLIGGIILGNRKKHAKMLLAMHGKKIESQFLKVWALHFDSLVVVSAEAKRSAKLNLGR